MTDARLHVLRATPQTCFWGFFDRSLPPVLTIRSGDAVQVETLTHQAGDAPDLMMDEGVRGVYEGIPAARLGGTIKNMFAVLIDPARLAGVDWFRREFDGFIEYVKASPPADPAAPVLVPGEPERIAREERSRTGIVVDGTTWEEVLQAGEKVGVPRMEAEAFVT